MDGLIKDFYVDKLHVLIYETRQQMGQAASSYYLQRLKTILDRQPTARAVFAAAHSQDEFLEGIRNAGKEIFGRVEAFHMDEYIGIDPHAPQAFGQFLRDRIFSRKDFKSVNYIDSKAADPRKECERYASLLKKMPTDIVFLGIGENGHLAFNDPHVAFFDDPLTVKTVDLDPVCIQQQVNDGCFSRIEDVPTRAYTITIPELLFVKKLFAIVPTIAKANAIKGTCDGPIVSACPASILRTHRDCTLYVDRDSASLISR